MSDEKNKQIDYFKRFCLLMLAVAACLLLINFLIPANTEFAAIDMLADVRSDLDDSDNSDDLSSEADSTAKTDVSEKPKVKQELSAMEQRKIKINKAKAERGFNDENFLAIEDYSKSSKGLKNFLGKLQDIESLGRPLRIAFLGDSFIESDIFTAPLRDKLQNNWGGLGVGMMGLAAEAPAYRKSINHRFGNWVDKSALHSKNGAQTMAGHKYVGSTGAWVTYKMPEGADCFEQATIYYTATAEAKISVKIAGETNTETLPATGGEMKSYTLYNGAVQKELRLSLLSGANGLTVFGIALDGKSGISLDNYALRGASGIHLGGIDDKLSRAFARLRPYDLIVLEYGLNVVSKRRREYSGFRKSMKIVVEKLKKYYPKTDILILGVSDRDQRSGTRLHENTLALLGEERKLAKEEGLVFWSTLDAVQQMGGVKTLVRKGLAAKDYTHLSHKGGEVISKRFYDALTIEKDYYDK